MHLLTEKCWQLIQAHRMKGIDHDLLRKKLSAAMSAEGFNIYSFTRDFLSK